MAHDNFVFTSESVTEGHPDKIADQISDGVLDAILEKDPRGRVACETSVTTGLVLVMGEITTEAYVDIPKIVRQTLKGIGYHNSAFGIDWNTCGVLTSIDEQSPNIAGGVSKALELRENDEARLKREEKALEELGAGDQGMMFGFACSETDVLMPMPIVLAHKLCRKMAEQRKKGKIEWLRPDGKSQVTIAYENGKPARVLRVLLAAQHEPDVSNKEIRDTLIDQVITKVLPTGMVTKETEYFVNTSGRFEIGGPQADSGLTGRKIIVDTYGGFARHGGGAFSGKDPSKVDRSASYAARWVAKNIVAAGIADKLEIQVAYAIGMAQPFSIMADSFGTGKISDEKIVELIRRHFDLRPGIIIRDLGLRNPIYQQVAAYGHFGRDDLDLPWERTDKADALRADAGI
jgi:S-adenosylmethionine synthetase